MNALYLRSILSPVPDLFRSRGTIVRNITSRSNNPYLILGVPPSSSFSTVQKAFVKLAFQYHPDTAGKVSADFIRIRQAFERIRDAKQSGKSLEQVDDTPSDHSWTETDFLNYFHRQTGVRLTSDQRRELVHLYRNRVTGGYYGGHSWDLARRLVSEQDAFLRNMQGGGPAAGYRKGTRRSHASCHSEPPEAEPSGLNNLRRKRKR